MTDAELIAREWYDLHVEHNNLTERFYEDPLLEDKIGIEGEIAFGEKYGLMTYWLGRESKPYGDGGIDFDVPGLGTIGVKTAQKAYFLLEKATKATADFYPLGQYENDGEVSFIGWAYGSDLAKVLPKDIGKKGILSHYIHRSKLRPMQELIKLIEGALSLDEPKVFPDLPELELTCADCAFGQGYKGPNPREGFRTCLYHGRGVYGFRPACKNIIERHEIENGNEFSKIESN